MLEVNLRCTISPISYSSSSRITYEKAKTTIEMHASVFPFVHPMNFELEHIPSGSETLRLTLEQDALMVGVISKNNNDSHTG